MDRGIRRVEHSKIRCTDQDNAINVPKIVYPPAFYNSPALKDWGSELWDTDPPDWLLTVSANSASTPYNTVFRSLRLAYWNLLN